MRFAPLLALIIICLTSPWSIPIYGEIDITLQSLWVILIPLLFGWKGALIIAIYLLLGTAGLPVFADYTSGWLKWNGTSAGYLASFQLVALILAFWNSKLRDLSLLQGFGVFILSHLFILALGFSWIIFLMIPEIDLFRLLLNLVPGLLVKSLVGSFLYQKFWPWFKSQLIEKGRIA